MKVDRIVAYGCSFTAGEESGDHIVYDMDPIELDKIKTSGKQIEKRTVGYIKLRDRVAKKEYKGNLNLLSQALADAGKKNSYIKFLADILDVPYSNRAVPGGSMEQIIFRLERDIHSNKIEENDLVIVGVTSSGRFFNLTSTKPKPIDYTEYSCVLGSGHLLSDTDVEFLLKWTNNKVNILWEYYRNLSHLLMLSEKYKDRFRILLVPALITPIEQMLSNKKDFGKSKPSKRLQELFDMFESICDHENIASCKSMPHFARELCLDIKHDSLFHGRLHPKKELHERFATYIYENCIKDDV